MPRNRQKGTRPPNDSLHVLDSLPFKLDMRPVLARQIGLRHTEVLSPFMVMLAITKVSVAKLIDVRSAIPEQDR